ncbi:hypothetical protein [Pseudoxanthomonas sp. PXM02]|uniref:hypothetical protein n=1 Tax=Pseudoxanthomonas sp. PXM02 TaxID=2769294 RepID=UPI0017860175|nr:hypothetical protein [Pseudoxanthomonas sp. PXM02]MBD9480318.1 hypothetical protein [Pseudoxanthomonas sp. PXM02]
MTLPRKIVIHSLNGLRPSLTGMVRDWIRDGVQYVGVVGHEAARIEDAIDDLCVGDGADPYFMVTAAHDGTETLEDAVFLAEQILTIPGPVAVVEL